jgi:hypothetical protein
MSDWLIYKLKPRTEHHPMSSSRISARSPLTIHLNTQAAPARGAQRLVKVDPPAVRRHSSSSLVEPESLAGRVQAAGSCLNSLLKSAVWLSLLGTIEGAAVPPRSRHDICEGMRYGAGYLENVAAVLSEAPGYKAHKPMQIHIVQDSLGSSTAIATMAVLCGLSGLSEHPEDVAVWFAPPEPITRETLTSVTGKSSGPDIASWLVRLLSLQTGASATPPEMLAGVQLEEILSQDPHTHASFFYFDGGPQPGPSSVLGETRPAVVITSADHALTRGAEPIPGLRLPGPVTGLFDQAGPSRVALVFSSAAPWVTDYVDHARDRGAVVVLVPLDEHQQVAVVVPPRYTEVLKALGRQLGPGMIVLLPRHEPEGGSAKSGNTHVWRIDKLVASLLAIGCTAVVFKRSMVARLARRANPTGAQQVPATGRGGARAGRGPGSASKQVPAAQSNGAAQQQRRVLSELPETADVAEVAKLADASEVAQVSGLQTAPQATSSPKDIASAFRTGIAAAVQAGKKERSAHLAGLGQELLAALKAVDHDSLIKAACIVRGVVDAAGTDAVLLARWFSELNAPCTFESVLAAVCAAADMHPAHDDLQKAVKLLKDAWPFAHFAMPRTGPDDEIKGRGRLGPPQRLHDRLPPIAPSGWREPELQRPAKVRVNLAKVFQFAARSDGSIRIGADISIPRADRTPHIHVNEGFVSFKKNDHEHWQLTEGDMLMVTHVQSAIRSLGPQAAHDPFKAPMLAFLLHLLQQADETPNAP